MNTPDELRASPVSYHANPVYPGSHRLSLSQASHSNNNMKAKWLGWFRLKGFGGINWHESYIEEESQHKHWERQRSPLISLLRPYRFLSAAEGISVGIDEMNEIVEWISKWAKQRCQCTKAFDLPVLCTCPAQHMQTQMFIITSLLRWSSLLEA